MLETRLLLRNVFKSVNGEKGEKESREFVQLQVDKRLHLYQTATRLVKRKVRLVKYESYALTTLQA
jgi:hypothetical protein